MTIPPELQERFDGKRYLVRSTGESDKAKAEKIAEPILAEFLNLIGRKAIRKPFRRDARNAFTDWLTPEYVFRALDTRFDQDVAASRFSHWVPAGDFVYADSIESEWRDFVFCNPPFALKLDFIRKFIRHRNGIILLPSNTHNRWWQDAARHADAILFVCPTIDFIDARTMQIGGKASFGSCLLGIGERAIYSLRTAERNGLGMMIYNRK